MHTTPLASLIHFPHSLEFLSSRELMRALAQLSRLPTLPLEEQQSILIALFSRQKDNDIKYQMDYLKYHYNDLKLFKMVLELDTTFVRILTQTMLSPASTLEHKLIIAHALHTTENKLPLTIFRNHNKSSLPYRKFEYDQLVQSKLSKYDSLNQSDKYKQFCSDFIDFNYTREPSSGKYVELGRFYQLIYPPYDPKILSAVKKAFKTILPQLATDHVQQIVALLAQRLTGLYARKNDLLQISPIILEQKNIDKSALFKPILDELIKKSNKNALPSTKLIISQLPTDRISKLIITPLIKRLKSTRCHNLANIIKELFEFDNTVAKAFGNRLIKELTTDPSLIESAQDLIPLVAPNMRDVHLQQILRQLLSLLNKDCESKLNTTHSALNQADIETYVQVLLSEPDTSYWRSIENYTLFKTIENLLPNLIKSNGILKFEIQILINYVAKELTLILTPAYRSSSEIKTVTLKSLFKIAAFILEHQATNTTILTRPILQILTRNLNQDAILPTKLLIPQLTREQNQTLIFTPLIQPFPSYSTDRDRCENTCSIIAKLLPCYSETTTEDFISSVLTRLTSSTNTITDYINTLLFISLLISKLTLNLKDKLISRLKNEDFHPLFLQLIAKLQKEFERGDNFYPTYTCLDKIYPYLHKADIQTYLHFLLDELNNLKRNENVNTLFTAIKNLLAQLINPEDIRLFIKPILNFFINLDHNHNPYLIMPLIPTLLPLLNNDEIQIVKEITLRPQLLSYALNFHFAELDLFLTQLQDKDIKDFHEPLINISLSKNSNGNEIKIIDTHILPKLSKEEQEQFMIHMLQPEVQFRREIITQQSPSDELSPFYIGEFEPTVISEPITKEIITVKKYYPNFFGQLSVANRTSKAVQHLLKEQVSEHQEIKDLQELQKVWLAISDSENNHLANNSSSMKS